MALKSYVLDYIENTNRMRKRLVVEDQLPESERLTYNIDVPLKKIDSFTNASAIHQYDAAITATGIDTLSLSSNEEASPLVKIVLSLLKVVKLKKKQKSIMFMKIRTGK